MLILTSCDFSYRSAILFTAWEKLNNPNDHVCPWIDEKEGWTKKLFVDFIAEK